jgi:ribosomal protein S18 acetylase RimI-like enzyme
MADSNLVRLRDATSGDISRIVEAWGELARIHEQMNPGFTLSRSWRRAYGDYLFALLGRQDALVVLAESGEHLAGLAIGRIIMLPAFFKHRRRGYIQDVYTREAYRRLGVARQMVERIQRWLHEQGVRRVELTVAVPNARAQAFWESLGYQPYMAYLTKEL